MTIKSCQTAWTFSKCAMGHGDPSFRPLFLITANPTGCWNRPTHLAVISQADRHRALWVLRINCVIARQHSDGNYVAVRVAKLLSDSNMTMTSLKNEEIWYK